MDGLEEILIEIKKHSQAGNRRALSGVLQQVMNSRLRFYHEGEAGNLLEGYADALYKILLLEMDEEEEDSIEIAELAYLALSLTINEDKTFIPEHYKQRLLLLHYFCDYFTDSVIEVFLKRFRTDNLLQARNLAIECLEKMQLSDMYTLEKNALEYLNGDEQLTDACNSIETNPNLLGKEREEAFLLHKVMYAYLRSKYKN